MAQTDAEIREKVTEVEQGFQELRELARKRQGQLYVHETYKSELIQALAPEIDTRIAVPSRRPSVAAWHLQGIIRQSFQFHVEPGGSLDRDETRADKRELYYAHEWALNFNKGGNLLRDTWRDQAVSPFCGWWFEADAFALPKEEKDREQYRKDYSPFRLSRLNPLTFAFLHDDAGYPTVAVRRFKLTYAEIIKRYGKDKDRAPLKILGDEFPFLRGGRGEAIDTEGELGRRTAEVCVFDEGVTICHYIDIKDQESQYHQVGQDYPNYFGCPSLILVHGRYNADAEKLEDIFQPLIVDILGEQRNVDVMDSHMASLMLTPSKHGQVLPEEVAKAFALEDRVIPGVEFNAQGWANLMGAPADIGTVLPPAVTEIRQHRAEDRDAALPSPFLTNPDESVIKAGTAAAQLNAHETSNRAYDEARESVIAGIVKVCKMIDHYICESGAMGGSKKGVPDTAKEKIHVRLTGTEPSRKYAGERKGEEIEIGPDDFDEGDILEVTPIAETESQKQLRYELKKQQVIDGVQTKEDLIAVITEDVSGTVDRLEEEARYQQWGPMIDRADELAMVEVIKMESRNRVDLSMILLPDAGVPTAGGPAGNGAQDGDAISGSMTRPPPTATPNVAVQG